jgi:hypothetical protein
MGLPPASLESQRSQRNLSFNILLSTARDQAGTLSGKHTINILCVLCGSAVNKILILDTKCLNYYCRISKAKVEAVPLPLPVGP